MVRLRHFSRLLIPLKLLIHKIRSYAKYVIEREVPGAGKLAQEELKAISQTSCNVISEMGPKIQCFAAM